MVMALWLQSVIVWTDKPLTETAMQLTVVEVLVKVACQSTTVTD